MGRPANFERQTDHEVSLVIHCCKLLNTAMAMAKTLSVVFVQRRRARHRHFIQPHAGRRAAVIPIPMEHRKIFLHPRHLPSHTMCP